MLTKIFLSSSHILSVFGLLVRKIEIRRLVGVTISNKRIYEDPSGVSSPILAVKGTDLQLRADMARPRVAPPFT